jgi:hypothetical protein
MRTMDRRRRLLWIAVTARSPHVESQSLRIALGEDGETNARDCLVVQPAAEIVVGWRTRVER